MTVPFSPDFTWLLNCDAGTETCSSHPRLSGDNGYQVLETPSYEPTSFTQQSLNPIFYEPLFPVFDMVPSPSWPPPPSTTATTTTDALPEDDLSETLSDSGMKPLTTTLSDVPSSPPSAKNSENKTDLVASSDDQPSTAVTAGPNFKMDGRRKTSKPKAPEVKFEKKISTSSKDGLPSNTFRPNKGKTKKPSKPFVSSVKMGAEKPLTGLVPDEAKRKSLTPSSKELKKTCKHPPLSERQKSLKAKIKKNVKCDEAPLYDLHATASLLKSLSLKEKKLKNPPKQQQQQQQQHQQQQQQKFSRHQAQKLQKIMLGKKDWKNYKIPKLKYFECDTLILHPDPEEYKELLGYDYHY